MKAITSGITGFATATSTRVAHCARTIHQRTTSSVAYVAESFFLSIESLLVLSQKGLDRLFFAVQKYDNISSDYLQRAYIAQAPSTIAVPKKITPLLPATNELQGATAEAVDNIFALLSYTLFDILKIKRREGAIIAHPIEFGVSILCSITKGLIFVAFKVEKIKIALQQMQVFASKGAKTTETTDKKTSIQSSYDSIKDKLEKTAAKILSPHLGGVFSYIENKAALDLKAGKAVDPALIAELHLLTSPISSTDQTTVPQFPKLTALIQQQSNTAQLQHIGIHLERLYLKLDNILKYLISIVSGPGLQKGLLARLFIKKGEEPTKLERAVVEPPQTLSTKLLENHFHRIFAQIDLLTVINEMLFSLLEELKYLNSPSEPPTPEHMAKQETYINLLTADVTRKLRLLVFSPDGDPIDWILSLLGNDPSKQQSSQTQRTGRVVNSTAPSNIKAMGMKNFLLSEERKQEIGEKLSALVGKKIKHWEATQLTKYAYSSHDRIDIRLLKRGAQKTARKIVHLAEYYLSAANIQSSLEKIYALFQERTKTSIALLRMLNKLLDSLLPTGPA